MIEQNWVFVFPESDLKYREYFVTIYGTYNNAKQEMAKRFPNRRFFQYDENFGREMIVVANLISIEG